jgi:hypothetical protein
MATERSRRLQPELRVRCDARQSGLGRHSGSARWSSRSRIRQDGQTRAAPGRVAAPPHRRAPRSHLVRTPRTRDVRTPTRDAGRPHPDIGHRTRGHRGHGHRTPDTGHVDADRGGGQGDQGAAGIRTSGPPRSPHRPLDVEPWPVDGACGALGNHDGSQR